MGAKMSESVTELRLDNGSNDSAAYVPGVEKSVTAENSASFPYELLTTPWSQRLLEIIVATTALVVFLPVMLLEAILIRFDSPGPALFIQPRLGAGTKLFNFVKFRTLFVDAKASHPDLYAYRYSQQELSELCFKVENDPRVTRAGECLRKSTLDELPNFWCLLTGEMALVGPRPEIPEMLQYYEGDMLRKFQVRPGITGLAQVSGRGRLGFLETVALDVEYVEKRSFFFDCKIILLTLKGVLLRDGAF